MLCEKCKQNEATTHLRESINDSVKEMHLCPECVTELGYDVLLYSFNPFGDMQGSLQGFLGSLFSQTLPQVRTKEEKCPFCGTTFADFASTAMAGCAKCYSTYYSQLLPSLERIHGKTRHVGKIPGTAGKELKIKREIEGLKQQLAEAVTAQEYEKAATLRDEIREIEKKDIA